MVEPESNHSLWLCQQHWGIPSSKNIKDRVTVCGRLMMKRPGSVDEGSYLMTSSEQESTRPSIQQNMAVHWDWTDFVSSDATSHQLLAWGIHWTQQESHRKMQTPTVSWSFTGETTKTGSIPSHQIRADVGEMVFLPFSIIEKTGLLWQVHIGFIKKL